MSFDDVMLIVSATLSVGVMAWSLWRMNRRRRLWNREFNSAVGQLHRGVKEHNDADFKAGLERIGRLMGLPEEDE